MNIAMKAIANRGTKSWSRWDEFKYRIRTWWRSTWLWNYWYWFRSHFIPGYRFHIIDIRDRGEGHGYKWGWCDRDNAMFLACFKCLCDYVEKEDPFEFIDWESDEQHSKACKEIKELYYWWTEGRAMEHEVLECIPLEDNGLLNFIPSENWEWYRVQSTIQEDRDDEMLERLMKIRKFLWT